MACKESMIDFNSGAIPRFQKAFTQKRVLFSKNVEAVYNEIIPSSEGEFDIPGYEIGSLLDPASDDYLGAPLLNELAQIGFDKLNKGPAGFPCEQFLVSFRESSPDGRRFCETILHVTSNHIHETNGCREEFPVFRVYTSSVAQNATWLLFPYAIPLPAKKDGVLWDKKKEGSLSEALCFARDWRAVAVLVGLLENAAETEGGAIYGNHNNMRISEDCDLALLRRPASQ